MPFIYYNPNPNKAVVGDCVIRAISKLFDEDWDTTYARISLQGFKMKDMPSSNAVWSECLRQRGFTQNIVSCQFDDPPCTVRSFADKHLKGKYLLFIGGHVVAVVNGDYYDTWDSGDEIPLIYWKEN